MKRLALLFGLGLLATVQATSVAPLTLAQQSKKAQIIVRATIGTPSSAKEGDVPYLIYPLTVTETVVGDAANLPQVDGKPALFMLQGAQDLPALTSGQEAIMLLYPGKLDSPFVGFNQGYYPIQAGKLLTNPAAGDITDPDKLRDAIRAALGGK